MINGEDCLPHLFLVHNSVLYLSEISGNKLRTDLAKTIRINKMRPETLQRILHTIYSRTSLIRTPKGQSEVSVLERCPYKRGHYDDVTFMTPLTVLSVQ